MDFMEVLSYFVDDAQCRKKGRGRTALVLVAGIVLHVIFQMKGWHFV